MSSAVEEEEDQYVFVYGTLKEGFVNHERVMAGSNCSLWGMESDDASIQVSEGEGLFVDIYYIPYLVLKKERGGDKDGENDSERVVKGELYRVKSSMLDILDELEGVKEGRYTRSEVKVVVPGREKNQKGRKNENDDKSGVESGGKRERVERVANIYHLMAGFVPVEVCERVLWIEDYQLAKHKELYVPREKRDPEKYQKWGGFL